MGEQEQFGGNKGDAEEHVLSESEIAQLEIKIQKSHRTEKDWDFVKNLLEDKRLYTLHPADPEYMDRYCLEGVLKDRGALVVFTSQKACTEFVRTHEMVTTQTEVQVMTIPFQHVIEIADDYEMGVCIDRKQRLNEKFLFYNGKTKSIHVLLLQ